MILREMVDVNKEIELSIFCLTYNHVAYIEDALKGFLKQKTAYRFNIFIFDDASTDGTSDIVRKYEQTYPDLIQAFISPVNTYKSAERYSLMKQLYKRFLPGKYIALCEGDDYWSDENKLQKQVEFLECHPECSMVTHAFEILHCADQTHSLATFREGDGYLTPEEIILQPKGNLGTASLVMRKEIFLRENGFPKCDVGDVPMQLYALMLGKIYYMDRVMSVYRYMHEGSWCMEYTSDTTKAIEHQIKFARFLIEYNVFSDNMFDQLIWHKIVGYLYTVIETAYKANQRKINIFLPENPGLLKEINRVLNWFYGEPELTEEEKKKICGAGHIYIMGKGKYSEFVKKSLNALGVKIAGYVLSRKDEKEISNDTFSLDEVARERGILLVIGISQNKEEELLEMFAEKAVYHFITPLWFERKILQDME